MSDFRDKLAGARLKAAANDETDSGRVSRMTFSKARLSSLNTSANDFMDVNQTVGSLGRGLSSPRAIASIRARICGCGMMPILIAFIVTSTPVACGRHGKLIPPLHNPHRKKRHFVDRTGWRFNDKGCIALPPVEAFNLVGEDVAGLW